MTQCDSDLRHIQRLHPVVTFTKVTILVRGHRHQLNRHWRRIVHISRIRLRNFRNFRNAEFRFAKGVNTLIGENGSGKTNAFHAIRLLLDDTLARGAIRLRDSDFNRASGAWKGAWIIISIDFEELDASEGCQIIRHKVGHMHATNRGTYTYFFRPNKAVRQSLFDLTRQGATRAEVEQLLDEITIEQYEPLLTGRATADFLNDTIYAQLAGDLNTLTFPNPEEEDFAVIGDRMLQPLHYEVSCTFVKALRDVVADLRNYRDSPLLKLLRGTERKINVGDANRILGQITTLNSDISSLTEIREIARGIQGSLHGTVGHTYSPSIDIQSAIPEELDRLLQRLCLTVSEPGDDGYKGDIDELSLGGANLIYLSLKLLEYELKIASDRVAHFLLIEEPESHIHTHIQKTLFEKYEYDNTQVIVSTHSTHISAASRIRSVNILAKGTKEAVVFHPANGLNDHQCQRIERYLDAVRSTLLFAKGVILVEGDAELILIPTLIKKVFGSSLDELGVSLVSMSSSVFCNVAVLFDATRIRRHCAILTDLDESIVVLPANEANDDEFESRCRASQESGHRRRNELDATCGGNAWLRACYAPHTFEVDFLMADNTDEVIATLANIYVDTPTRDESATKLRSNDIAIAGREVLRLAKRQGKGWFAILLADHVSAHTVVPDYILDAVVFACESSIDRRTVGQMIKYRCDTAHPPSQNRADVLATFESGTVEDACRKYVSEFPDDILSKLIGLLG
jgi:putative ATP-dependent endonuclease of OLD family